MMSLEIEELSQDPWCKTVTLSNSQILNCPKARDFSVGNPIVIQEDHVLKVASNGMITIYPPYKSSSDVDIGKGTLPIHISEPLSRKDWEHIDWLRGFHYREQLPFGRRGVLVATTESEYLGFDEQVPVGFVEASFPPICNSARDRVLDSRFQEGDIAWNQWRHEERGRYGHLMVGIPRVVIHPDFRGVGLGAELLKHCVRYVSRYWESRGSKPIFLEIVADMLNYNTFPRRAGFRFVGYTEGNTRRVAYDAKYHLRKLKDDCITRDSPGVTRMQHRRASLLERRMRDHGITTEDLLSLLRGIDAQQYFQSYDLLHDVVRLPKPTWMIGLTDTAQQFLDSRVRVLGLEWRQSVTSPFKQCGSIVLDRISVTRRIPLKRANLVIRTAASFGMPPKGLTIPILTDVSFEIAPGDICVINGPSGCGKTTLLRLLARNRINHRGHVHFPRGYNPKMVTSVPGKGPVVTLINAPLEQALRALASAGLSEARLYVQDVSTLSEGQKERLRLAMLHSSDANAWLVDDFAAFLDEQSAGIVSKTLRRMVKRRGVTLVLASPRANSLLDILLPDLILNVSTGGRVSARRNPSSSMTV